MSRELFSSDIVEADEAEMRDTLARPDAAVFVLERDGGGLAGYVEVGARSIVDGCLSSPVGYIEAWYVDADVRQSGHGRALLKAAEDWARSQGYTEMGSDALIWNEVSHAAHKASGYEEVDRVVNFRKSLTAAVASPNVKYAVPFFWVTDIARSLDFYVNGLQFAKTREWIDEGKLRWCCINIGEASLMLQEIAPHDPRHASEVKKGEGVSINFVCRDALALYRDFKSRGIDAQKPFVGNGMWVTAVTDPDGYSLFFESPTYETEEKELEE